MDRDKRPRRRLRHLRRDRALNSNQHRLYRHALARPEPEPTDLSVTVDEVDTYPADAIQRSYSQWGCSPPPPPQQRRD